MKYEVHNKNTSKEFSPLWNREHYSYAVFSAFSNSSKQLFIVACFLEKEDAKTFCSTMNTQTDMTGAKIIPIIKTPIKAGKPMIRDYLKPECLEKL